MKLSELPSSGTVVKRQRGTAKTPRGARGAGHLHPYFLSSRTADPSMASLIPARRVWREGQGAPAPRPRKLVFDGGDVAPSAPQGTSGNVWRHFRLSHFGEGALGMWQAEAGDAAEHLVMHKAVPFLPPPPRKNHPAPRVSSAQKAKPCSGPCLLHGGTGCCLRVPRAPEPPCCWRRPRVCRRGSPLPSGSSGARGAPLGQGKDSSPGWGPLAPAGPPPPSLPEDSHISKLVNF